MDDIAAGLSQRTGRPAPASGTFETKEELRAYYGDPDEIPLRAHLDHIHEHYATFMRRSPFIVIGTADPDGMPSVSPKGEAPGFVRILDQNTIAIPDRPGNKQIDNLLNLLDNPGISVIFLIPGISETLRLKGIGSITTKPEILAEHAVNGRLPLSVILIEVRDIYIHCGKSVLRSKLWNPDHHASRGQIPTIGRMFTDQNPEVPLTADKADELAEQVYRTTLF